MNENGDKKSPFDDTESGVFELNDFFQRLGLLNAELTWFVFNAGQLGIIGQVDPDKVTPVVEFLRRDIDDQRKAAMALWDKMEELLANVERNIQTKVEEEQE